MKKPNSETQLVKTALALLKLHCPTGVFYRTNTGAFAGEYNGRKRFVKFGVPGLADITGVLPGGRALYVECKSAKGKQSPAQAAFQQAVEAADALYVLIYSLHDFAKDLSWIVPK
jgi:hypothetical protein